MGLLGAGMIVGGFLLLIVAFLLLARKEAQERGLGVKT